MMDKEKLYVVLPCYNEEKNIGELVMIWSSLKYRLLQENIALSLIVVNDGSSDETLKIAKKLESLYDDVKVINHEINRGLGEAVNSGINYVLSKDRSGILCIMDADMTHDPEYIFSMLGKMKKDELHCVVASRYRIGSRVEGLSFYRKFMSYGARLTYTLALKIPGVRDYTCGYRLYKLETLEVLSKKYNGSIVKEKGFACMMELLTKLHEEGFKIGEVPFVLKYQLKGGKSKMRVLRTVYRSILLLARL
jgi:dolichol-phosphate mannosyltransferase